MQNEDDWPPDELQLICAVTGMPNPHMLSDETVLEMIRRLPTIGTIDELDKLLN